LPERRLLAVTEARLAGYGGIAAVVRATGVAASTIGRGLADLAAEGSLDALRVRRQNGANPKSGRVCVRSRLIHIQQPHEVVSQERGVIPSGIA